jgi:NAD(P)-dependent dehydrogenase (short-subunit alcohol dehydrogenase family)
VCTQAVDAALRQFGRVDVLVNNAGLGTAVPALKETPHEFRRVLEVNLMGADWMAQARGRVMEAGIGDHQHRECRGLITSYAPQAAYSASKARLIGLSRDLSAQWAGRRGIRVNAIAPGYFVSEMTNGIRQDLLMPFIKERCPLGRLGTQSELDAAVIFLASRASGYITGSTIAVDGGMSGH